MINTFTILSCIFICFTIDTFILFSIMENKIKRCKDTKRLLPILLNAEDKILYLLLFFMSCAFLFTSAIIMLLI